MLEGKSVTIVGAGIGGLTAALALAARGAQVRVLEQAGAISEVGAGLQITPNGVAVLDALGLSVDLRKIGLQVGAIELKDYQRGARVVRMDLAWQNYLLLHRADLIGMLAQAAKRAGVKVELNKNVVRVSEAGSGVEVELVSGHVEQVELLVGAGGLHSKLRSELNGERKPFFTGQVAWRAIVPAEDANRRNVQVHMGPGRHVVTYPLRGGELTNIVAVEERSEWAAEGWNHPGDVGELKQAFSMFCPEIRGLLEQVEAVNVWGLFRHPVADRWHGQRSALLGDAAHPTLPFLAQGANMALEDAWVLADCLSKMPVDRALPAYQARRRARVVRVIAAANVNARNYHISQPIARVAAHSILRFAGAVAPKQLLGKFDWVYQHDVTAGAGGRAA